MCVRLLASRRTRSPGGGPKQDRTSTQRRPVRGVQPRSRVFASVFVRIHSACAVAAVAHAPTALPSDDWFGCRVAHTRPCGCRRSRSGRCARTPASPRAWTRRARSVRGLVTHAPKTRVCSYLLRLCPRPGDSRTQSNGAREERRSISGALTLGFFSCSVQLGLVFLSSNPNKQKSVSHPSMLFAAQNAEPQSGRVPTRTTSSVSRKKCERVRA